MEKVPVFRRALEARIRRHLKKDDLYLKKCRSDNPQLAELGDYYIIDENHVVEKHVDIISLAQDKGLLKHHETIGLSGSEIGKLEAAPIGKLEAAPIGQTMTDEFTKKRNERDGNKWRLIQAAYFLALFREAHERGADTSEELAQWLKNSGIHAEGPTFESWIDSNREMLRTKGLL